ncbi:MAG: DNA polymerase I, partial [Synergistaceae bacterium]|nr:DNA polymerase I [Synergistaceae bacterium]
MKLATKSRTLLIVDGHGLAFRAFYAVPPLNAPDGTPTNAILGFMNMLTKIQDGFDAPSRCAVVFDAPGPTFRHELYKEYKAQRKPTPEEFKIQVPLLKDLLTFMGYPVVSEPGVEADDVIASLARATAGRGGEAVIVSSDKDLFQALAPGVRMLRPVKGITTLKDYDEASFTEEFGFSPQSMPDYLALLGDASDNVPGVPGIGEKTALQLIREAGTLERLFESLESQKAAVGKKLAAGKDSAFQSRELIRLKFDLPLPDSAPEIYSDPSPGDALALCKRLGLSKLVEKLKNLSERPSDFETTGTETVGTETAAGPEAAGSSAADPKAPAPEIAAEAEFAEIERLLESDELALVFSHAGKYPPEAASSEIQLADSGGCCAVLRGLEISPDFWERLAGKKLFVNDYKELAACFGPRRFEKCAVWDLKT